MKPKKSKLERELAKPSYVPLDFKLSTLRELVIQELEANDGAKAKSVVRTLVDKAVEGDAYCLRLLLERVDGLMTKSINVNGAIAVGQVVTLVDTRGVSAELPISVVETGAVKAISSPPAALADGRGALSSLQREGILPSLEPTPTSPELLTESVKAVALEAAVEVLGNVSTESESEADEETERDPPSPAVPSHGPNHTNSPYVCQEHIPVES